MRSHLTSLYSRSAGVLGALAGLLLMALLIAPALRASTPLAPAPALAPMRVMLQNLGTLDPNAPISFDLIPTAAQLAVGPYTQADIDASFYGFFVGPNAVKVLANPADASAVAANPGTITCTTLTPSLSGGWRCTTSRTKAQIVGSTAPGPYQLAITAKLKKADGTFAAPVVSQSCTFSFPIIDNRTSITPTNLQ
jgi:hypothetical protein